MKSIVYLPIIITIILFLNINNLYAIGEIGIGFNLGIGYDSNNISNDITDYNIAIEKYKTNNTGTSISQLSIPIMPTLGLNFRYQFNYILFRFGGLYSRTTGDKIEGQVVPAVGTENHLALKTYKASFPVTTALLIPLKQHTLFYFGGGLNLDFSSLEISQTDTSLGITGLPTSKKESFNNYYVAYHLIVGTEIPISKRYTITAEWIHTFGITEKTTSPETGRERTFNTEGNMILFGINYYADI